jgi:hypothetical protein
MDKKYLELHFWEMGKSIDEIAKELKVKPSKVFLMLKFYWWNFRNINYFKNRGK